MSPATPSPPSRPVAISLDVGGVLVVPDHGMIGLALRQAGIEHDRSCFGEGHYRAMAAVDHAASHPEDLTDYLWEFLEAVGVATSQTDAAHELLLGVVTTPVWCQPVPGSRIGLRALADAGLRLAVTSNSDGTVADHLRRHEWVQVGEGPGVSVEVITDSGIVGVGKPDPQGLRRNRRRARSDRQRDPARRRQRALRRRGRNRVRPAGGAHGPVPPLRLRSARPRSLPRRRRRPRDATFQGSTTTGSPVAMRPGSRTHA